MKKIELLAPAGNMDSLVAAVMAGADAVYLGGTMFGARAFAGNFTNDEIVAAIKYCHLYGVKVYVTCNILIYEHEVENFVKYVDFLYQNDVDAIIIQDLGMTDLLHQTFPNLELHASTQMHIHNLDGVMMANKIGCKRVVLARETPIEVVKNIINKTGVDIEIFAHGSLCVSYSGQCLFSSLIGNRSGNRGSCVGSCRLPYKIVDENGNKINSGDYPLSMKDLNTLESVGDLIDSGVTSLKIEGRMKSPEYVYTVTKLYREAIDSYYQKGKVFIDQKEFNNLQKIFSRGYTKGYLFYEDIGNIINPKRPNHQGIVIGKVIDYQKNFVKVKLTKTVSINDGIRIIDSNEDYGMILNEFYRDKKLVKEAHSGEIISFKVNKKIKINSDVLLTKDNVLINEINNKIKLQERKVPVSIKVLAKLNEPLMITCSDGVNEVTTTGEAVSKSLTKEITKDDVIEKISQVGDTIYNIEHLDIELDEKIFISFKELKNLRRSVFEKLNEKRLYHNSYERREYHLEVQDFQKEKLRSVLVSNYEKMDYDIIYSESGKGIIKLPKVMDNYDNLDINKEYLVGELGAFNRLKNICCDYSFNVTNSYTVALLHFLGAKRITVSLEINPRQLENLINAYEKRYHAHPNLEVIVMAYREVMTLKTNLNKIYQNNNLFLVDRFDNHYKVRNMGSVCYIYEPHLFQSDYDYYSIGVNVLRDNCEI